MQSSAHARSWKGFALSATPEPRLRSLYVLGAWGKATLAMSVRSDKVSELRVHVGAGWRVYFRRRGEELVILLCVGSKSSQAADIAKAKRMAAQL